MSSATVDPGVAATRGLWDTVYESIPSWDEARDAAAASAFDLAVAPLAGFFPVSPSWLVELIDPDIVPNMGALVEGAVIGAIEQMPNSIEGFIAAEGTLLSRAFMTGTGIILLTNPGDVLWGMGEGIVQEFTDLWKLFVTAFSAETWAKLPGQVEKIVTVMCGDRDAARAIGRAIGSALAGQLKGVLLGPLDKFAHALGKLLGPIIVELAVSFLTAGVGLAGIALKYGFKLGRFGVGQATDVLKVLNRALKTGELPPVSTGTAKEVAEELLARRRAGGTPGAPDPLPNGPSGRPGPSPDPSGRTTNGDRGLDMSGSDQPRQPATAGGGDAPPPGGRPPDAAAGEPPRGPRGGQPKRVLRPDQITAIEDLARRRSSTNPGVPEAAIVRGIRSAAERFGKLDIDHPETLTELSKLISETLRRRNVADTGPSKWKAKVAATGELRMIDQLNLSSGCRQIRMVESGSGGVTPDFRVSFDNRDLPDVDIEVRTLTGVSNRTTVDARTASGARRRVPSQDPTRSKASRGYRDKIRHGQLDGDHGRPGVIALNTRRDPNSIQLTDRQIDNLRSLLDDHPNVTELWLIGPGGDVVPVLRQPGAFASEALGFGSGVARRAPSPVRQPNAVSSPPARQPAAPRPTPTPQ